MTANTHSDVAPDVVSVPTVPPANAPPPVAAPEPPYWGTILVLLTCVFMTVLDFFIVNAAIPSLQRNLRAGSDAIELIVAGFSLGYGVFLITAGRLGDIFGRRRMFTLGMVLFTLSSAACGVAPTSGWLVAARVVQGVAAGLMGPQVLTIIGVTYTGATRMRAFGAYGVIMGIGSLSGQLIGGALIQANLFGWGWRSCFLINVPIGIAAMVMIPRHVPESRAPGRPRLDVAGMALVALALVAVVLPLIEGRQHGWPLWSWLSLAAVVPLFVLFGFYELSVGRRGGSPLVDLRLFRERVFAAGLLTQLVFWTGQSSFFLVFALYLQLGRGLSALDAGLVFAAMGAGYMATSTTARFIAARIGRQVIALGGLLRAIGLGLQVLVVAYIGVGGHIGWLIPALIIDGAGQGLVVGPLAQTILSRIKPQHAGTASGVLSTGLQVGNAIGVAVVGVIFYGVLGRTSGPLGYAHAFEWSLIYIIAVGIAVAAVVQLLPRKPKPAAAK